MSQYQPQPLRFKPTPFQITREYESVKNNDEDSYIELTRYPSSIAPEVTHNHFTTHGACLYAGAFLFVASLCCAVVALTQSFTCLGPPYIYVTMKDSRNLMKFSRDGCLVHQKVLWGVSNLDADMRGMAIGSYQGKEALYIADAGSDESGVMLFGECFDSTSLRPFIARVVTVLTNPGAHHAYAVAVDALTGDVYSSFQNTGVVIRVHGETFEPYPVRSDLQPLFLKSSSSGNKHSSNDDSTSDSTTPTKQHNNDDSISNNNKPASSHRRQLDHQQPVVHIKQQSPNNAIKQNARQKVRVRKGHKFRVQLNDSKYFTTDDGVQPNNDQERRRQLKHNKTDNNSSTPSTTQYSFYNGTFVQFGLPNVHKGSERGLRGLAWVNNYTQLWITNEDIDGIVIVDRDGRYLNKITITSPIGLFAPPPDDGNSHIVFVGSKVSTTNNKNGAVYAIDSTTHAILKTFQFIGMKHPTGIVSHRDVLFVADQSRNAVVAFNITTTRVIKQIITDTKLPGVIEQMILSWC